MKTNPFALETTAKIFIRCFSQARLSEQQRLELLEGLPKASVFELESLLKV